MIKDEMRRLIIIMGIGAVIFYLLPIAIFSIGEDEIVVDLLKMCMMSVNPLFCFMGCFLHANKFGFKWYMPIALTIMFIQSMVVFYDFSVIIYAFSDLVIGVCGSWSGARMLKRREKMKDAVKQGLKINQKSPRKK